VLSAPRAARAQDSVPDGPFGQSQSLHNQSDTGPNGAVVPAEALTVNQRMGADRKAVFEVAAGVYQIRGWGSFHGIAIKAPDGPIEVAAILFTHWHYANGAAARRAAATQTWSSELLDANRKTESGPSPFRGVAQSRGIAQFGMLHPVTGPDALPNQLGFTVDKLTGTSSFQSPENLFPADRVARVTIAGEAI
jgi:hypothetical protein